MPRVSISLALISLVAVWNLSDVAESAPGDFNGDAVLDSADLVEAARLIPTATSPALRTSLDLDRNGYLDAGDLTFLEGAILGRHGFLPEVLFAEVFDSPALFTREPTYSLPIAVGNVDGHFTVTLGGEVVLEGSGSGATTVVFAPLVEGINFFYLTFQDDSGLIITRPFEIHRDTIPPNVVIETPETNELIRSLEVRVAGQAVDSNIVAVSVNGFPMETRADGTFTGMVRASAVGPLRLTATATDAAGNTASDLRNVELFVSAAGTVASGRAQNGFRAREAGWEREPVFESHTV